MESASSSSIQTSLAKGYSWASTNRTTLIKAALVISLLIALGVVLRLYLNIIIAICVPVGGAIVVLGGSQAYCKKIKAIGGSGENASSQDQQVHRAGTRTLIQEIPPNDTRSKTEEGTSEGEASLEDEAEEVDSDDVR
jgi:hypothetical protein